MAKCSMPVISIQVVAFAVNNKPVVGTCQQCGFGLLIEKKLASGVKLQCADRKCHAYQEPESLDKTE